MARPRASTADLVQFESEIRSRYIPECERRIERACGGHIAIEVGWMGFRRSALALVALHAQESLSIIQRIASAIEKICEKFPGGRGMVRSRMTKILVSNEAGSDLQGHQKVGLEEDLDHRKWKESQTIKERINWLLPKDEVDVPAGEKEEEEEEKEKEEKVKELKQDEGDEADEEDEAKLDKFVLHVKGNFGSMGSMGGPSRQRIVETVARRFGLLIPYYRRQLEHDIIPICVAAVNNALHRTAATSTSTSTSSENGTSISISVDWASLDDTLDEKPYRNLTFLGGRFSFQPIVDAFESLANRLKAAKISHTVKEVRVCHVPGIDISKRSCYFDLQSGTLFIYGVWEIEGWRGCFKAWELERTIQYAYKLHAQCGNRIRKGVGNGHSAENGGSGEVSERKLLKKYKYLRQALRSPEIRNGHVAFLKNLLTSPCFSQPEGHVKEVLEQFRREFVEKEEVYIHGWSCCKINHRGQIQERLVVLTDQALYTFALDAKKRIDAKRTHRHAHDQYRMLSYGHYKHTTAPDRQDYCVRYETLEPMKKGIEADIDEPVMVSDPGIGKRGGKSVQLENNKKVLHIFKSLVDIQLATEPEVDGQSSSTHKASKEVTVEDEEPDDEDDIERNNRAQVGDEVQVGQKNLKSQKLLRRLALTIARSHGNYNLDLPKPCDHQIGILDLLSIIQDAVDEHLNAELQNAGIPSPVKDAAAQRIRLATPKPLTLHLILTNFLLQLHTLMDGDKKSDRIQLSLTLPKSPSVHLLSIMCEMLKQLKRVERADLLEEKAKKRQRSLSAQRKGQHARSKSNGNGDGAHDRVNAASPSAREESLDHLETSTVNSESSFASDTTGTSKKRSAKTRKYRSDTLGTIDNNKRLFHFPMPEMLTIPLAIAKLKQYFADIKLTTVAIPPKGQVAVDDVLDAIAASASHYPIPAVDVPPHKDIKMVRVLERCIEAVMELELDDFMLPTAPSPRGRAQKEKEEKSWFLSKVLPKEPDNWVILLTADPKVVDPKARRDLALEITWSLYAAVRIANRPLWVSYPFPRDENGTSSFFGDVYNKVKTKAAADRLTQSADTPRKHNHHHNNQAAMPGSASAVDLVSAEASAQKEATSLAASSPDSVTSTSTSTSASNLATSSSTSTATSTSVASANGGGTAREKGLTALWRKSVDSWNLRKKQNP